MALTINPSKSKSTCYALCGKDIVLHNDGSDLSFADIVALQKTESNVDIVEECESGVCFVRLSSAENLLADYTIMPLRNYFGRCSEEQIIKTSRAKALGEWLHNTRYCSKCGAPLYQHLQLTAQECKQCGTLVFPRIEPCVIVRVNSGNNVLLVRHVQRIQNIYACISGFMEAGETAEQAVRREVREEVGIEVKNIRYFGSQSWPFPSQLMLGFTAEYESGQITLQPDEIAEAKWFDKDNYPSIPQPGSIAYRLLMSDVE